MEKLYTIKEAMGILKVTRRSIYNWHEDGKIHFVRVNGNPRIKESELKKFVKEE